MNEPRVITNRFTEETDRFVIVCNGIKSGQLVYLQDQTISKGGFWTQYKQNARIFATRQDALNVAGKFHYNAPSVIHY